MPLSINTNLFALNAQRNLNKTQAPLTQAMQRLSSTLRINSAKDDAAGLAIATRMTRQVNGLSVAMRNANDGTSIAQTAEGAMDEMLYALQKMNELATQAASYNTSLDRSSLNQEVAQLIDEMSRIVSQTRYNGEKILAGGFNADIQVGVEVNETININITNLSPTSIGVASTYNALQNLNDADFAARARLAYSTGSSANPAINNVSISSSAISPNTKSANKIALINATTASHGVSAFNYGNSLVGGTIATGTFAAGEIIINGISINGGDDTTLIARINEKTSLHGVTAVNSGGTLVFMNRTGAAINVTIAGGAITVTGMAAGVHTMAAGENGLIVLNQRYGQTTVTFDAAATGESLTGVSAATTATLVNAPVSTQVITSAAAANLAILAFKEAMEVFNAERSIIGAKLNRFESTIRNLDNVRENISAAKSRIMDADFAVETSNLTKALIMQQAGISVLAQANTLPQNVLALLQR